jgi:uncharacterized protein YdbL (DUF1318 family)
MHSGCRIIKESDMRRFMRFNVGLSSLLFAACVTINVYFPAAAAEKAADQIIDTVTSGSGPAAPAPPAAPPRSSADPVRPTHSLLVSATGHLLTLLVPAAQAQADANLDISSPAIRAVTDAMQARFDQLEKYFTAGSVGLTNDGLIEIRDQSAVALAERALVKRLVAEDNRDRNTLYAEIAKANGHPEWEPDIRKIFARRWVERGAKPGWYYQGANGEWVQK